MTISNSALNAKRQLPSYTRTEKPKRPQQKQTRHNDGDAIRQITKICTAWFRFFKPSGVDKVESYKVVYAKVIAINQE
jgi:hypothetical protein